MVHLLTHMIRSTVNPVSPAELERQTAMRTTSRPQARRLLHEETASDLILILFIQFSPLIIRTFTTE